MQQVVGCDEPCLKLRAFGASDGHTRDYRNKGSKPHARSTRPNNEDMLPFGVSLESAGLRGLRWLMLKVSKVGRPRSFSSIQGL